MSKAWVYILRCSDKSYYTGSTTNLEKRLDEHRNGEGSGWTKKRLPVELVFSQEMPDKNQAYMAEQQIKKWSRAKKEALIGNNWDLLKYLAKKPKFIEGHKERATTQKSVLSHFSCWPLWSDCYIRLLRGITTIL